MPKPSWVSLDNINGLDSISAPSDVCLFCSELQLDHRKGLEIKCDDRKDDLQVFKRKVKSYLIYCEAWLDSIVLIENHNNPSRIGNAHL